jgi:hypothetical protein
MKMPACGCLAVKGVTVESMGSFRGSRHAMWRLKDATLPSVAMAPGSKKTLNMRGKQR